MIVVYNRIFFLSIIWGISHQGFFSMMKYNIGIKQHTIHFIDKLVGATLAVLGVTVACNTLAQKYFTLQQMAGNMSTEERK